MHLRSITLRGFKSFADRTSLDLEPGLVVVVGPNGAGKSNLIDALMWSLGTLSARTLRAEKMEDVIFTGTEQRKALGMAQVVLTLDNTDATFPLDFSEVQVGRTLFRDGASDYSINGTSCRLLDVQELLAEAGLGRELHAVVAQGEVDDIVQSRPEELRAYVEEAAGIAKHRKRKDRALRRLDQVSLDIDRAADVANELRRQLRPLRAQAEQARRHTEITDRLREIRIRRLVGELEGLDRDRKRALESRSGASEALTELRGRLDDLRAGRMAAERKLDASRRSSSSVRRGLEHLRSAQASALRAVIVLRERAHARPDVRRRDAIVLKLQELDAFETEARGDLEALACELEAKEAGLISLRERDRALRLDAAADGERLLQARQEATTLEAGSRASEQAEITARAEAGAAAQRADRARAEIARIEDQANVVRREIEELDAAEGRASLTDERLDGERKEAKASLEAAEHRLRELDSQKAVLEGRMESLRVAQELAAERRRGAEALRKLHGADLDARGVLGQLVRVPAGLVPAVEAVLGPVLDALVVGAAKLADAVERAEAEGSDVLVVPTSPATAERPKGFEGARPLAEVVDGPAWLRGAIDALCEDVYLVARPQDARALSASHPEATFVTSEGRVLRGRGASRPARKGRDPALELSRSLEQASERHERIDRDRSALMLQRDRHAKDMDRLDREHSAARAELGELEGRIAAAADRLREMGAAEKAANLERDLAEQDRDGRLHRAEALAHERQNLGARKDGTTTTESTLAVRIEERERELATISGETESIERTRTELLTRRASLEERLRGIRRTRDELGAERIEVEAGPTSSEDLAAADSSLSRLDGFVSTTEARVRDLLAAEDAVDGELREVSEETSRVEVQVASLEPRSLHASEEVARLDVRIEEIGSRLAHEFEIPPSRARQEFPPAAEDEALDAEEKRLERELRRMGPVNPLAAREIATLDSRREFLETQLEDLRTSRRDLLKVVRTVDAEMRELLVKAADDANAAFQDVVELLFPEGGGRIRLAGADDPLEAGVEIEVRLGRKGHRKLSFLSGGEKALAGLGFLFALHLARPTPFLVLDEVDAPLDDANLGRFLRLLDSLRTRTQVVVITHQKRTMERADTLVGVTLHPDGTSRLVTQRLQEHPEHVTAGWSASDSL